MSSTLEQLEAELRELRQEVTEGRRARDELEIQKVQSLYSHYYQIGRRGDVPSLFAQHTPGVTLEIEDSGVYEGIKSIGAKHCIMSTDSGQWLNPVPVQQMGIYINDMLRLGLSANQIRTMVADNPARALGL